MATSIDSRGSDSPYPVVVEVDRDVQVNIGWVDQLPVDGKNAPECEKDKLKEEPRHTKGNQHGDI